MTTFDFSNFAALRPVNEARRFAFDELAINGLTPEVWTKPANETNPDFFNASLRRVAEKEPAPVREGEKVVTTAEDVRRNREADRESLASYCVTRLVNVPDASGAMIEYSPEAALAFLQAIPDSSFDRFRQFAMKPDNFRPIPTERREALGKPQPKG